MTLNNNITTELYILNININNEIRPQNIKEITKNILGIPLEYMFLHIVFRQI